MSITRTRSAGGPSRNAPGSSGAARTVPETQSGISGAASGSGSPARAATRPPATTSAASKRSRLFQQDEVGAVAGSDRAQVAQPVVARRVQRGHEERVLGRDALRHRLAAHRVEMPFADQRVGLAVVRAERAVLGAVPADELEQRAQVARVGRLADEHPQAAPPLLQRLLPGRRLVVRVDAGGHVGVERAAGDARRVPVDVVVERDLLEHGRVAGDDGREVHHLGDADRPPALEETGHLGRAERALGRLQRAGRHARRGHHVDAQGEAVGGVEQPVRAFHAEHVGDLVRVAHDRRGPARHDHARDLAREELRGLQVDVGVDQPRHERPPPASIRSPPA